jgi:hypothetical protein
VTDPVTLRARLEALKLLWQGMEQQALEAPANLSFAQLAHDTWVAIADVLTLLDAEPRKLRLATALRDLLAVISADELIPESVSYMRQAREALLDAEPEQGWQESKLREAVQEYLDWGAMTGSDRDWFEQKFREALATPPQR